MLRYIIGISILTIGIIIVRALSNGKVLRKHQYAFWIVIPLYMMLMPFIKIDIPVAETIYRLFSSRTEIASNIEENDISPTVFFEEENVNQTDNENQAVVHEEHDDPEIIYGYNQIPVQNTVISDNKPKNNINIDSIMKHVSFSVSAALIVFLITYNIVFISYCRRNRKYIGRDPQSGLRIYSIRHKEAPFLLFNKIYIDNNSEKISEFTICHEACHFKHCDYLWVLIRYLVLFINWYNPIIWTAFFLSGHDCELACDEEVMKIHGAGSSKDYARTLLGLLQQQSDMKFGFTMSSGMNDGYKMMKKRIINIKKPANNSQKALALSMATILLVTSCSFVNNTKTRRKITKDDPWFDTNIIEVKTGAEEGKTVSTYNHRFVGSDEQYYVILTTGDYEYPPEDEIDWNTFDAKDYKFQYIAVVDKETYQTVNEIDINKDMTSSEYWIDNVYFMNGIITVKTNLNERDYDPVIGKLLDIRSGNSGNADVFSCSQKYYVGDYSIETIQFQPENSRIYYSICIGSPDGDIKTIEFKKIDKDIQITTILALSDTQALIPATVGNETLFYELDLSTGEMNASKNSDYAWMDADELYTAYTGSDGMVYFKTETGISRINAKTQSIEEIFNYNWCVLNRGLVEGYGIVHISFDNIVECSEDRIVLLAKYVDTGIYTGQTAEIVNLIILEKAETNPNAGKMVLELYARTGVNKQVGEAISKFNITNDKFFIEVIDRYKEADNVIDLNNVDTGRVAALYSGEELSNQLAIDIMNGDGPDILLDVSEFSQLSTPNCLADLTPYLEDLDSDTYYKNIIEGSKTDGSIYQLPISFKIEGVITKSTYAGSSGKGFTLEEYTEFVDEVMNGTDPILYGQATYFAMLISATSDKFISNGKVDLSVPEFAELAEYVRDNVREEGAGMNEWYAQYAGYPPPAKNTISYGIGSYFVNISGIEHSDVSNMTVLGYPSLDGNGPMFSPISSVAISSQTVDIGACAEFVKTLLSEDIQTKIAMDDSFVLNRKAFRDAGICAVEYYNSGGEVFYNGFGMGLVFGRKYDEQDIDSVEDAILACSKIRTDNSSISIILIEEMPPYFLGQKDLDSVIKIAENRIQKVLDERG